MTSQIRPSQIIFSDVNIDVLLDSPYELVYNEDAIRKSLENIFTTPYRSRPFRRKFGSKLLNLLYDPVDALTASKMSSMLRDLSKWETRIDNVQVKVLPDIQNQRYYVEMSYTIKALGDKMVNYRFNVSK